MIRSLAASIQELEKALEQKGMKIRYERLKGIRPTMGGYCIIKGQPFVIIEKKARDHEKYEILLDALARVETDDLFLSPRLRDVLDKKKAQLKEKKSTGGIK